MSGWPVITFSESAWWLELQKRKMRWANNTGIAFWEQEEPTQPWEVRALPSPWPLHLSPVHPLAWSSLKSSRSSYVHTFSAAWNSQDKNDLGLSDVSQHVSWVHSQLVRLLLIPSTPFMFYMVISHRVPHPDEPPVGAAVCVLSQLPTGLFH